MDSSPRYRLVRTIAAGGMAQVLEAVLAGDAGFERRVAIKRILPEIAHDEQVRRMFLDEARVCGRLHHSNIVQVVDYGTIDGSEFIAMEYVDGADARRACRHGATRGHPIPQGVALHVIAQIAHALHYAHTLCDDEGQSLRLIHRDISPHNVLLSWSGDVKLADFGIALAKARQEQTRTGIIKGKEAYMAPEQALGQPLTAGADVYALGPTLHAMLCGQPPEVSAEGPRLDPELDPRIREQIENWIDPDPGSRPTAAQAAGSAGRLSASLLGGGDPRTSLREWLALIRPELTRRSALDDLLGMAVFADGKHRFTVRRHTVPVGGRTVPVGGPADNDSGSSTSAATRSDRPQAVVSRARYFVAGAAVLAVALVGFWTLSGRQETNSRQAIAQTGPSAPGDHATATAAEDSSTAAAIASRAEVPLDQGLQGAPDSGASVDATAPRPAVRHRHRTRRSPRPRRRRSRAARSPRRDESPRMEKEPAADRYGWLRVGGASLARMRVEVDGKNRGFSPIELKLRQGVHSIAIRRTDTGEAVLKREVTVKDHHTRGSPLKLIR
ncbi:MAG: serine/threonine protein kinase [Deltaproteobacteria bacterium]|jgi:serine/threonine-protein kinase|nr:serine/threonine protein kinase [Deltaproteobacteria bacterium]